MDNNERRMQREETYIRALPLPAWLRSIRFNPDKITIEAEYNSSQPPDDREGMLEGILIDLNTEYPFTPPRIIVQHTLDPVREIQWKELQIVWEPTLTVLEILHEIHIKFKKGFFRALDDRVEIEHNLQPSNPQSHSSSSLVARRY